MQRRSPQGFKVADVAWASAEFLRRQLGASPYTQAPEIVVEVLSAANTRVETEEKKELYFARGVRKFWICADDGSMTLYDKRAQIERSTVVSDFPARVELAYQ